MTKLICDTNVFYDLGDGKLNASDFDATAEQMYYSPISVLEIAGKLSSATHEQRRAAAQAILNTRAVQLPDPESFLTDLFGFELIDMPFDFGQAVEAMAQSQNMGELTSGVYDVLDRVTRKLKPEVANSWRSQIEGTWVNDFLKIMKRDIQGFDRWYSTPLSRRTRPVPRLRGAPKREFVSKTSSENWQAGVVGSILIRATFKAKVNNPSTLDLDSLRMSMHATGKLACYCNVFTEYLKRLLTEGALPQPNDSGDLELFLYSIDDANIVVTAENKWTTLAQRAGFAHRVRKP